MWTCCWCHSFLHFLSLLRLSQFHKSPVITPNFYSNVNVLDFLILDRILSFPVDCIIKSLSFIGPGRPPSWLHLIVCLSTCTETLTFWSNPAQQQSRILSAHPSLSAAGRNQTRAGACLTSILGPLHVWSWEMSRKSAADSESDHTESSWFYYLLLQKETAEFISTHHPLHSSPDSILRVYLSSMHQLIRFYK